ncbi:MAG: hypothetical protein M5U34_17350 [Chloroflexi bacterium]|nr:hypothetical protein [Chloroflexota bacterium]
MTDRLTAECEGLILTTAAQISLSLVYDTPIDLKTGVYQYNWGMNHLANLCKPHDANSCATPPPYPPTSCSMNCPMLCSLRQTTSYTPSSTTSQNKLLNIQLTHELLQRFGDTDKFTPPCPPKQDCPLGNASAALCSISTGGLIFYVRQMRLAAAE